MTATFGDMMKAFFFGFLGIGCTISFLCSYWGELSSKTGLLNKIHWARGIIILGVLELLFGYRSIGIFQVIIGIYLVFISKKKYES